MTAKADADGQWSYILEDPLEPGDHTAYAIVQQEGDYVRSDGVAFALEPANASDENPNGFSLVLASSDTAASSSRLNYIVAAVALVLFVSIVLARFVWFRKTPFGPANSSSPVTTMPTSTVDQSTAEPESNSSDQKPQGSSS
jgi:hypothetical protein